MSNQPTSYPPTSDNPATNEQIHDLCLLIDTDSPLAWELIERFTNDYDLTFDQYDRLYRAIAGSRHYERYYREWC